MQSLVVYWFKGEVQRERGKSGGDVFRGEYSRRDIGPRGVEDGSAVFGLIETMVFTHVPSNVLLILVPLMPNLPLAITMLLLRFSISQMDVPARQSYTMAVVAPEERAAAAGVTGVARTTGSAISPAIAGQMLALAVVVLGAVLSGGGLKILYDVMLWRSFKSVKTDEVLHQRK